MQYPRILSITACALIFAGCQSKEEAQQAAAASPTPEEILAATPEVHGKEIKQVEVTSPLNQEWVTKGQGIFDMKCMACHKLTDQKLVGPGWAGVTKRREPVWIMNMITNVEMMLEKDPEAMKLLELCLVRMPNQNLTTDDARHVLEFMRSNDGEQ